MDRFTVEIIGEDGELHVFMFPATPEGALQAIQEAMWISLDDERQDFKGPHVYELLIKIQRLLGYSPIRSAAKLECEKGTKYAKTKSPDPGPEPEGREPHPRP